MSDRLDPQMRAAKARMDEMASQHPPVTLTGDMVQNRRINELLSLDWTRPEPVMAQTEERWVAARGRRILCRLHRPTKAAMQPLLVWMHGGGWVFGTIDTHDRLVRQYAAEAGFATVSIDYALAPEAKFPTALLECEAVLRHIVSQAQDWGIDPGRVVIGGDSAGGNLALALALLLRDNGGPTPRGLLLPYPVTEAACNSASYQEFESGFGLTREGMGAYWNAYLRDHADRLNPLASPLRADARGLPPTLIQVAELDVLRDEGIAMAEKLRAAGVEVTLEQCPGVLHGFMRLSAGVDEATRAITRASAWLRQVVA